MPVDPARPAHLPPLSAVMPSLLLGTATFNTQYVDDPSRMPYRAIVRRALDMGVCGFDTSPYYGPSEELLGEALAAATGPRADSPGAAIPRAAYFLETKAGRVASAGFDYTPAAMQASVRRSLARLRTDYVDLVYAHDAEFETPAAVVGAVRALRALRSADAGAVVRYVGISGFPVDVLAALAERILAETGEPVDAVLSYGHCTVQNARLVTPALLARLRAARVGVVLNASLLNMGLLTTRGVDCGPQAAWHPSPPPLRRACAAAAAIAAADDPDTAALTAAAPNALERVALRYALDVWARAAAAAGLATSVHAAATPVGASVLGVTSVDELSETVLEWWSVLDGLGIPHPSLDAPSTPVDAARKEQSLARTQQIADFVHQKLWPALGEWKDYAWASPPDGWVNELKTAETQP